MRKRQIKKTVVRYQQPEQKQRKQSSDREERSRSRDRNHEKSLHKANPEVKVEQANVNSRRARLEAMRKAKEQEELDIEHQQNQIEVVVKMEEKPIPNPVQNTSMKDEKQRNERIENQMVEVKKQAPEVQRQKQQSYSQSQQEQDEDAARIVRKPVFISREYRQPNKNDEDQLKQQERKRKNARYTAKLLLEQQKYGDSEEENYQTDSQNENNFNGIDDNDTTDEELQFQKWKIRQLARLRKAWEERRKHQMEKAQIDRRRTMTNEAILLENKALGSDATDNEVETKYTFMQKFYHKGAFYQDSEDQVFKRDYNLPTPMEMQDKTLLPKLLQKRVGNFGKKGQSKYTHLTAEDTSDLNPLSRPDESLLQFWKKKTAGYKGSQGRNI